MVIKIGEVIALSASVLRVIPDDRQTMIETFAQRTRIPFTATGTIARASALQIATATFTRICASRLRATRMCRDSRIATA